MTTLDDLLRDKNEYMAPTTGTQRWLRGNGVSVPALCYPRAIGRSKVIFDGYGGYYPSPVGDDVFVFPTGSKAFGDLVAWYPQTGQLAARLGLAPLLGIEQIEGTEKGRTGLPLRVFRSPMSWLKAGRQGVVIVSDLSAVALLAGLAVVAEDEAHRLELTALVERYQPTILAPARGRVGPAFAPETRTSMTATQRSYLPKPPTTRPAQRRTS